LDQVWRGGKGRAGLNIRFTVKGETLYAIILGDWPGERAVVTSLAPGRPRRVRSAA